MNNLFSALTIIRSINYLIFLALLFLLGCNGGGGIGGGNLKPAPSGLPNKTTVNTTTVLIPSPKYIVKYVRASSIPECSGSGVLVYSGSDTDADSILDDSEVFDSSYICDGKSGENGKNGQNGLSALMNFERQTFIKECGTSGLLIAYGLDSNTDLLLGNEEIQKIEYICDGQDAPEPTMSISSVAYPCGKQAGFNEILMKMSNGDYIAYFENGNNRHLTVLEENTWYSTTDNKKCTFKIVGGAIVYK